jgi:hypothetical protein
MTATGPRHQAPDIETDSGTQQPEAAAREPQDRTDSRPGFVIEIWASPQLRSQDPGRPRSLSEALGRQPADGDREPDQEPEIEP